jgi:hypothetical protein
MKKTIYIVGGSAMGIVLAYFGYDLYRTNKSKNEAIANKIDAPTNQDGTLLDGQESSKAKKQSRDSFPLKVGSYGFKVFLLQSALNKLGSALTVDGKFGQKTYDALSDTKQWGYVCNIGQFCGVDKTKYLKILSNAKQDGWNQANVELLSKEKWIPFTSTINTMFRK